MPKPEYDRRKTRRAMLIAPAAGLLGVLPFVFQLNLTFMQFILVVVAILAIAYLFGLVFGAPGYLILRHLGYPQARFLMAYAVAVAIATPILLDDIYALLTFGPPILAASGAFCFLRGPAIDAAGTSSDEG